jgi:phosphate uptake regulator
LKHFERIADHSTNIAESVFLWFSDIKHEKPIITNQDL